MEKMKVFLSWSGSRSRKVANSLREWLPNVLQTVEPWMAPKDIDTGKAFTDDLRSALATTNFGVLCLTKDSCKSPWVLFEAGALAKLFDKASVCPYLIDLSAKDLPDPLAGFQAVETTEEGTLKLVEAVNHANNIFRLSDSELRKSFCRWWPDFRPVAENNPVASGSEVGRYYLINTESGGFLHATHSPRTKDGNVKLSSAKPEDRDIWCFHKITTGEYAIRSGYTHRCLDVQGRSSDSAALIQQYEYWGGDNQRWTLHLQEDGTSKIQAKHSEQFLAYSNGRVSQMPNDNSRSQRWWVIPVSF